MPELVRLYLQSALVGLGLAFAFTAGLVWLDVAGIGRLILASDIGWIAALMLVAFNGIVFGAVQFAISIMGQGDDGSQGGHGAGASVLVPVPVPIAAKAVNRRQAR